MAMKDYILKNGKVYNSQSRCFEEKNIVVSEGKITAMEAGIEKEGITEIDLEGMMITHHQLQFLETLKHWLRFLHLDMFEWMLDL